MSPSHHLVRIYVNLSQQVDDAVPMRTPAAPDRAKPPVTRGYIGIEGRTAPCTRFLLGNAYSSQASGVEILEVEQGSPAKEAGLCRGDIILSLGGEEAQTVEELRSIMTTLPIDAQALVSVLREGALTTCLITPSKRPQLAI